MQTRRDACNYWFCLVLSSWEIEPVHLINGYLVMWAVLALAKLIGRGMVIP